MLNHYHPHYQQHHTLSSSHNTYTKPPQPHLIPYADTLSCFVTNSSSTKTFFDPTAGRTELHHRSNHHSLWRNGRRRLLYGGNRWRKRPGTVQLLDGSARTIRSRANFAASSAAGPKREGSRTGSQRPAAAS